MNVKDFDRVSGPSARRLRQRCPTTGLSPKAAILGVICAVAVFACLGLLYAVG